MNSKANLDTSTSQPKVDNCHWENPRICATCTRYHRHYCTLAVALRQPEDPACTRYTPKQTD